jgi:ribose 5-phosphate isomerase B
MAMTANRVEGVRAAVVADPFSAQMAAEHNDARVLCLGERVVGDGVALACVESWVNATFAGGRHLGRIEKMGRVRGE